MILSCLTFALKPGALPALRDHFHAVGILERASAVAGCRALYLTADDADPETAHVLGVWEDRAAYQRWLDHPQREAGADVLRELVSDTWDFSAPGGVWPVLHTTPVGHPPPAVPTTHEEGTLR